MITFPFSVDMRQSVEPRIRLEPEKPDTIDPLGLGEASKLHSIIMDTPDCPN